MFKKLFSLIFLICIANTCSAEDTKLVVLLDWFANPNHAPLFVAQSQGFFKEQGLDPADPPKLVAAGKADIAITYEPNFMEQIDQGLPLTRIGTLIDIPLNCLVVLKNSSIKTLRDLKGKDIGYSSGEMNSIALKAMLEKNGLDLNQVNLINVHYTLTQALLSGKVDAVTGIMRNFELIQMELAGHPGHAFFPEQNGMPTYSELIFVARSDKIHDPKFKRFLIGLQKGMDYLQKHPRDMWLTFAKNHSELNDELNQRAWLITLPYFAKNPNTFNAKNWQRFAEFLLKNGLINSVQPINKYAVDLSKE